ncbi:ABC transporter ATP-binding protein [Hyphomonas sp.]|uniref:ABC transporter ATP-binding protein n=1 Tax=Hyphomonas sp. TaxID=87 RepID=UPI003F701C43|tara:strand:+ start:11185 stop:12336 length:1152 start_codon:yes stop_codon:yes gene_type:complete
MAEMILENVSVSYRVRDVPHRKTPLLTEDSHTGGVVNSTRKRVDVAALNNISMHLRDGDRLGILGHNGAGKTTLLRVMSGILPPMSGRIRVEGHLSPLLSIQLGLSNHSTGYENIFIRARYMGVPERVIRAQADEIAAFSELGDYIHFPISTYSSGMRLRLAFAIATAFSPEVLILDEWLSAGDAQFQAKAAKRLHALIDNTGIFVMASHNPNLIKRVCNMGLVLNQSRVAFLGPIDEALATHKALQARPEAQGASAEELFRTRVMDLQKIQKALELYHHAHGAYPSTDDGWHSVVQQRSENWLPDLVPEFLDKAPRDPKSTWDFDDPQYCYMSNGEGYKLIARRSGDANRITPDAPVKRDPKRTHKSVCWAYGMWTDDYAEL